MNNFVLEAINITKDFPGVRALDHVNFHVKSGKIHGLVGENGAGKSTLLKIFNGLIPYGDYEGSIIINNQEQRFSSPKDAHAKGIG